MRKILLSIIALTAFSFGAKAQNVNIPDANFKAYLIANTLINTNGDTEIQVSEATAYTGSINCSGLSISDLTGIEALTALTQLWCYNNSLSALDVSQNTALTQLNCYTNTLTSLDVTQNTALTILRCYANTITSLDVSQNTALTILKCYNNSLTSLNVANGNNTNITVFTAYINPNLTCIQVDNAAYSTAQWSSFIDTGVYFSTNCGACIVNIPDANFNSFLVGNAAINTNGNTVIECTEAAAYTGTLNCSNLSISDLTGIGAFTALTELICFNNTIASLDVTQNTALTKLDCQNNSLLSLNVTQNTGLIQLYCQGNSLSTLDVSQNTALALLYCNNNSITSLDLTQNTGINQFRCQNNSLTSLNVVNGSNSNINTSNFLANFNPNLTCIQVDDVAYSTTNWTSIDAASSFSTNCPCLVTIPDANFKAYLVGNTAINTNGDTEIQCSEASAFAGTIDCSSLNISDLTGIEAFTGVTDLRCFSNSLSSLNVTQNTALTRLECNNNSLTSLDVTQNTALTRLYSHTNPLNTLDVTQNTALILLYCNNNSLSTLDITQNTALIQLWCYSNSLSSLDVTQNTTLTWLYCNYNSLSSLDVTQNTALTWLYCNYNSLSSLNVANGNNTSITNFDAINNPNLTCIEVDNVAYSTTNWTNIDAIASFSLNCNSATGVGEIATQNISIYPNPVTNQLNIEFGVSTSVNEQIQRISILNITGKIVKTIVSNNNTIDVSNLTKGIYFLQIQTENGMAVSKFIKD